MYIGSERSLNYRRRRRNSPVRISIYLILIGAGLFVLWQTQSGNIDPIGLPTPTATRTALSFAEEAEAAFSSGDIPESISAYQQAVQIEPDNVDYLINLARYQTYGGLVDEAVETAKTATFLDDDNSMAYAVLSFALDWQGSYEEASNAAVKAIQLDGNNALAHAYYAEILTDTGNWTRANDEGQLALSLNPNLMDAHRTYGNYLTNIGAYDDAISHYRQAATINPNLPFLHIQLGLLYRAQQEYELALEFFNRALALDPENLAPYLSISRTYFIVGELVRSAQYLEDALEVALDTREENPDYLEDIADIYGRSGMVKVRNLNYEGALTDLTCAIEGCDTSIGSTQLDVPGLELNAVTLQYYYTYTSMLAAYAPLEPWRCDVALPIMYEIELYASDDDIVMGIVNENRTICRQINSGEDVLSNGLGDDEEPAEGEEGEEGSTEDVVPEGSDENSDAS